MIALTVREPWATLLILGVKRFETRSWSTKHRGQMLIHSAKGMTAGERELVAEEPFASALIEGLAVRDVIDVLDVLDSRRSHFIGGVRLENVLPSEFAAAKLANDPRELAFGNYSPDRFAWRVDRPTPIPTLVQCRGALSLWRVPPAEAELVRLAFAQRAA